MSRRDPAIGFISLGCPKALVDSERILTQLRVEGYRIVNNYEKADAVVVNTCGFIESAVQESLDAIGEALHENGKVIVTGCLGKRADLIREAYPEVQAISGPQDYASVMHAVHALLPPRHDPLLDLLPPTGIKLTPRHYAYLKISEGCNHRCSFCIIPSLRGDLASRPVDAVLAEAEALVRGGVQELLVISQDTSAYGVDLRYAERPWRDRSVRTRMTELTPGLSDIVKAPADQSQFDVWDPANVSPLVAYLATEGCPLTGRVFYVQGGTVRNFQNWTMTEAIDRPSRWTIEELEQEMPKLFLADPSEAAKAADTNR